MPETRCLTCQKPFDPGQSRWLPFCSERCKLIDLGRWLDERVGMPCEPEDEPPPSGSQSAPPES